MQDIARYEILVHRDYPDAGSEVAFILDLENMHGTPLPVMVTQCYGQSRALGAVSVEELAQCFTNSCVRSTLKDFGWSGLTDQVNNGVRCAEVAAQLVRDYESFTRALTTLDELCCEQEGAGAEINGSDLVKTIAGYGGDDETMVRDFTEACEAGQAAEAPALLSARLQEYRERSGEDPTPFSQKRSVKI